MKVFDYFLMDGFIKYTLQCVCGKLRSYAISGIWIHKYLDKNQKLVWIDNEPPTPPQNPTTPPHSTLPPPPPPPSPTLKK